MSEYFSHSEAVIADLAYRDNLSFFLMNCLLRFVRDLQRTTVVSVFYGMLMFSQAQRERLMELGITFVQGDYSRGYEPVYMNDFHFYHDIYLINVEDVEQIGGLLIQLHAAQLLLNPDRQTFIFHLAVDNRLGSNQTVYAEFASEYIFEFLLITTDQYQTPATHHLPVHQGLVHMQKEDYFGYYYWNSCMKRPARITDEAISLRTKAQLRQYFSDGHLCPPKGDKIRVRLSVWEPFVNADQPRKSGNFTSGLDIQLISLIAQHLNMSLEYSESNLWEDEFSNMSTANNWKALQEQTVDIVLSSTVTTSDRNAYFHATSTYFYDSDRFCVPKAMRIPQHKKWFAVFDIYGALFGLYFIYVPVAYYFGKNYNPTETLSKIYLNCIKSMCSMSISRMVKGERVRWFYMCWLLYCFLLNVFYHSKLISIMYKPTYEKQISTPEELVQSQYKILIANQLQRYFNYPFDPIKDRTNYQIQQMMESCEDLDACIRNVTINRDCAVCIQTTYLDYRIDKYLDSNGVSLIYCFKEIISHSYLRFHVNRNFALLRDLDKLLMFVQESGLINKWAEDIFRQVVNGENLPALEDPEHKPLELGMLRIWFYFYMCGMGLSIVGCLAEVAYYRRRYKGISILNKDKMRTIERSC